MFEIIFEKAQDSPGKVNRGSVIQKQSSEGFFKRSFMRNFAEFTKKNICAEKSFLIKSNFFDLQLP